MPFLVKNINAKINDSLNETLNSFNSINFSINNTSCNHISTTGFEAFVFDFSKVTQTEELNTNLNYGLTVNNKSLFTELNISY